MSEQVPPLDRRLLDALRADLPAPSEARDRARARLVAAIPAMRGSTPGDHGGGGDGGAAGGSLKSAARFGARTLGLGFVVGGMAGAALFAALAKSPAPRIVFVDRPAPQAATMLPPEPMAETSKTTPATGITPHVAAMAAAGAPHTSTAQPVDPGPTPASAAVHTSAQAARSSPSSRASRLGQERLLLDEARAGLVEGDPERALQKLESHRAHFADGLLAEEREAMLVEALVRLGRYDEAREGANRFRARAPGSLFLPTVESAIASIP